MARVIPSVESIPTAAPPQRPNRNDNDRRNPPQQPDQNNDNDEQTPPEQPDNNQNNNRRNPPQRPNRNDNDRRTPPQQPDQYNDNDQQTPPEQPDQNGDGEMIPPERPEGDDSDRPTPPDGQGPDGMGGPGGDNSAPTSRDAANVLTENSTGASYTSTADGENAVLVSGGAVTLSGSDVSKTGSSSGDSADFYGVNAAVLATDGASLVIEGGSVTSDGSHANGIFSYGSGTSVTVSDTSITTSGSCSGGLMTTGGASMTATNVIVSTSGNSSAAIRSDRGGGTVTVTGGSFETAGVGSPAIYSTAAISVSDATLSASNSEAVVIEGGNSVSLSGVTISGSNATLNGQSTQSTNVLIYQSMSGDAAEGNSTFTMNGGSMTALTGSMFHVTNVTTTIDLNGVDFIYAEDSDVFLSATADSWGSAGRNGGSATVNLTSQSVSGRIEVDEVSSVSLNLAESSSYTGAISSTGTVSVTIAEGSTWTLTGDSYVTSFTGDLSSVNLNGYTLYVDGVAVN